MRVAAVQGRLWCQKTRNRQEEQEQEEEEQEEEEQEEELLLPRHLKLSTAACTSRSC